jgi:hypothetical protein
MIRTAMIAALSLAGCSSPPAEKMAAEKVAVAPPPTPVAEDSCGASALQHLIGRPRSEAPAPVKPELQRVACTTCAVTMDFNPERLNIFFNEKTGLIERVSCG